jgi:hypothetical protein
MCVWSCVVLCSLIANHPSLEHPSFSNCTEKKHEDQNKNASTPSSSNCVEEKQNVVTLGQMKQAVREPNINCTTKRRYKDKLKAIGNNYRNCHNGEHCEHCQNGLPDSTEHVDNYNVKLLLLKGLIDRGYV